jgi:hypothetical protein
MSDRVEATSAPANHRDPRSDEAALNKMKALARALAHQAAPQLWAAAMLREGLEPSAEPAAPTQPERQRRTRRHANR